MIPREGVKALFSPSQLRVELLRWSGFGSGQAERCAGKVKILAKVE